MVLGGTQDGRPGWSAGSEPVALVLAAPGTCRSCGCCTSWEQAPLLSPGQWCGHRESFFHANLCGPRHRPPVKHEGRGLCRCDRCSRSRQGPRPCSEPLRWANGSPWPRGQRGERRFWGGVWGDPDWSSTCPAVGAPPSWVLWACWSVRHSPPGALCVGGTCRFGSSLICSELSG